MDNAEAAAYIGRWRPSSVSAEGAAFARDVVMRAGPEGRERAKSLLQSAGKLADYGIGLGLAAVPEVLLHPSTAERFTRCAPGLSPAARRTLRTNLRFTGRRVVPHLYPADLPLPRERSKKPYGPAEISGFLALADAQPTMERRMRATALICLGAGAGLIRGDLRDVRGTDVACRSGGVLVQVRGPRARAVPVLARYQDRLLAAAAFTGSAPVCGGTETGRRNITTPLVRALDGGGGLPRLDTSRLRATWLAGCGELLLLGMTLALADGRPAHLTRVHQALASLPEGEQRRLGVLADWKGRPHPLTYRQAEYTFRLVRAALGKDEPDGLPSPALQAACDDLLEAGIPEEFRDSSASLAVDWTDLETFSRPPPRGTGDCADPEASWGHRKNNLLHDEDELFFGYYLSAAVTVPDEQGPPVPELARRMTLSSCRHDPVPAFTPVLTAMPQAGIPLGDVLADSGYSHRVPQHWAAPLRRAGAALVQDLHPHDRGPRGTHQGAVIANGSLYCPAVPRTLLELGPLARGAAPEQAGRHDAKTAEAARYKLGRLARDDEDGYHRVQCPAAMGKVRCPLRQSSMTLDRDRPEILAPPEHPQARCTRQTITIPAGVLAKTAQKHDYPSAAWRRSYARRSGAERGFATAKDPASNDIARGWCRLTGLAPLMLFTTVLLAVRNQRILAAWNARQDENARRATRGLPPKTRRRRRKSPATAAAAPP